MLISLETRIGCDCAGDGAGDAEDDGEVDPPDALLSFFFRFFFPSPFPIQSADCFFRFDCGSKTMYEYQAAYGDLTASAASSNVEDGRLPRNELRFDTWIRDPATEMKLRRMTAKRETQK